MWKMRLNIRTHNKSEVGTASSQRQKKENIQRKRGFQVYYVPLPQEFFF